MPSFAFVCIRTTVVTALMYVGKYCSCVKYKLKHMLKCLYIPLCEVTVCVRICCVDIFQKWAWYCPPQFGQQFTCVGFCDTKQEMWSRWRQKKKKKSLANVSSAGVLQCPALATLSLLVVDGTAAGWKKNCFSNQCCGINEFDVVKSTSSLVWMFANSFK